MYGFSYLMNTPRRRPWRPLKDFMVVAAPEDTPDVVAPPAPRTKSRNTHLLARLRRQGITGAAAERILAADVKKGR